MSSSPKNLDFSPRKPLPSIFPLFTWHGKALNHFQTKGTAHFTTDLSHLSLSEAMLKLYPKMTFAELSRFYSIAKDIANVDWGHFFEAYGYRFDERLKKLINTFLALPFNMQNWIQEHHISPKDIFPLTALSTEQWPNEAFDYICANDLSRSQGSQLLDLLSELILMDVPWHDLKPQEESLNQWLIRLKALRFPNTMDLDAQIKEEVENLPWPKNLKPRWFRQGDQSGAEIKLQFNSQRELQERIDSLNRVLTTWQDKP